MNLIEHIAERRNHAVASLQEEANALIEKAKRTRKKFPGKPFDVSPEMSAVLDEMDELRQRMTRGDCL